MRVWLRDASIIINQQALLLVGLGKPVTAGYDYVACGYLTCGEFAKNKQMKDKEMGYLWVEQTLPPPR
jgi:uncharacterized ferredoxin-like protein